MISIVLLVINGIGACFGGLALVIDPTGQNIQIPLDMLKHSPFSDYFIPGMILLVVLGMGSLAAGLVVKKKVKGYPVIVAVMGVALTIWIIVEVLMIQSLHYLHVIFGGIGIALVILGGIQWKRLGTDL
jgi:hypothetical protein